MIPKGVVLQFITLMNSLWNVGLTWNMKTCIYTTDCPWSLHSQPITLLSVQCINTPPPKLANQKFLASLSEAIDICLDSKLESILMGNLNFNQLSNKDSTHGLVIICQSYHTDQLNHTLTRTGLCLSYIHTHTHTHPWDLLSRSSSSSLCRGAWKWTGIATGSKEQEGTECAGGGSGDWSQQSFVTSHYRVSCMTDRQTHTPCNLLSKSTFIIHRLYRGARDWPGMAAGPRKQESCVCPPT